MRIEALVNPGLLVWAREMAGMDTEEAARKVKVSPERLLAWEHGELRPTINQARNLANAYKRPLAIFYLEAPPPADSVPPDFRRLDPGASHALSPELRLAIRTAHARRLAALELLDELEEEPATFALRARLNEDPEDVGLRLRAGLEIEQFPEGGDARTVLNRWRIVTERAGVLVFQAEDVEVSEMRAFSISEHPLPAVVMNIKDAYPARTFSLLHELAHLMLGRSGLCNLHDHGPQSESQQVEVFCNHVAGAALIPASTLLDQPEVPAHRVIDIPEDALRSLARRFGTSREAVLRRLVHLNRATLAFYQRKRAEYARERTPPIRAGGFAPPHTMAVATSGHTFTRLVLEAYDAERITSSDLAEYLGVRFKHLARIRSAVSPHAAGGEEA